MLTPVRRHKRRGRTLVALVALLALAAAGVVASVIVRSWRTQSHTHTSAVTPTQARRVVSRRVPVIAPLAERTTGRLAAPVQDEAAVLLGGPHAMLLGGLTAADTS